MNHFFWKDALLDVDYLLARQFFQQMISVRLILSYGRQSDRNIYSGQPVIMITNTQAFIWKIKPSCGPLLKSLHKGAEDKCSTFGVKGPYPHQNLVWR